MTVPTIAIIVSGDEPVALADTVLSIRSQTTPAVLLVAGEPFPRGVRAVLELQAGDMLIADAVERLDELVRCHRPDGVVLPVLVQAFAPTRVRGAPGRSALGRALAPQPDDRTLELRATRRGWGRARSRAASASRLAMLGARPYAVLSRAGGRAGSGTAR